MLQRLGNTEVVFDTVNKSGVEMMRKKYMKPAGYAGVKMFFYLDSSAELARKTGGDAHVLAEEAYAVSIRPG